VNKRPGQITVIVESGFCSFCDRTRNLRREERQLGALVRTVTSCESCHRVLSSTIGVAEPDAAVTEAADAEAATPAASPKRATAPRATGTAVKPKAATDKPKAASKPKAAPKRSRRSK
jgi:cell division septation protein DedD